MKYYAIKKGRDTGIFMDWSAVQPKIQGFKGAEYKSFQTREEARKYLENSSESLDLEITQETVLAYVDGSYFKGIDKYGSGIVILDNARNFITEFSFSGNDPEFMASNNVAGEICATIKAIEYAIENDFRQVVIYFDYEGIEKWANGSWSTNKPISKYYFSRITELKSTIDIRFVKVDAHTGDEYNECADLLAKNAIRERSHTENKDGSITLKNIPLEEVEIVNKLIEESFSDNFLLKTSKTQIMESFVYSHLSECLRANYYFKNRTLQIQGKPSNLMYHVMSYFIQLLPNAEEVINTMNELQEDNVSYSVVESTFQQLLPNYRITEQEVNNALYQAVQNYETSMEQHDYTYLIFPAFRALEYFLHKTLSKAGLETANAKGVNTFSFFDKNRHIQEKHKDKFSDVERDYVESLYEFYRSRRHKYFHWAQDSMDTAIIEDIQTVRTEIKDACEIMDKYYIIYK